MNRHGETIVEAAAPIFNRRGYEGSSPSDLMQTTGLKKGGIYRHFSSKEEKLKQFIANFTEQRSTVGGGCPILNTAIDADDGNPVLRAHVAKALRASITRLQNIVEQARERGETQHGVGPKAVATLIIASLEGALMLSRIQRSDETLRRVQSHLNHYLDNEVAAS